MQVRRDCQSIAPIALSVSNLQLYDHNPTNLVHDQAVFDNPQPDPRPTKYLCRSHYKQHFVEGEFRIIGDFLLKLNPASAAKSFAGQFKFGIYNYVFNLMAEPFSSGDFDLTLRREVRSGRQHDIYETYFVKDGKTYNTSVSIRLDNLEGTLTIGVAGETPATIPSVKDPPHYSYRVLCYTQQ